MRRKRSKKVKLEIIQPVNEGVYDFYDESDPNAPVKVTTADKVLNYYIEKAIKYKAEKE